MNIDRFMETYKRAWESSGEHLLASLFAADGLCRDGSLWRHSLVEANGN
ncbi:MAG: hypothetical protein PHY45_16625 [Rhodocyclaceae bacterium]|nr:hypothetical protein [Rhodocyclaceae bacterium]